MSPILKRLLLLEHQLIYRQLHEMALTGFKQHRWTVWGRQADSKLTPPNNAAHPNQASVFPAFIHTIRSGLKRVFGELLPRTYPTNTAGCLPSCLKPALGWWSC